MTRSIPAHFDHLGSRFPVAEFERTLIRERQREGIAIAKKAGAYKGRKPLLTVEQVKEIRRRAKAREQKTALATEYGVSRQTLYSALAQRLAAKSTSGY
jgi:DNA invertase Pin-like site-specific DNA recombinase